MNVLHEYALLFAVAAPVVAIVAINLVLRLAGERGTLLLPALGDFPAVAEAASEQAAPAALAVAVEVASIPAPAPARVKVANHAMVEHAA